MTCGKPELYTIYDNNGEYGYEKGDHTGKYFRDRVIELTDCQLRFFEGIDSDCREIQVTVAKQISKLLSE